MRRKVERSFRLGGVFVELNIWWVWCTDGKEWREVVWVLCD